MTVFAAVLVVVVVLLLLPVFEDGSYLVVVRGFGLLIAKINIKYNKTMKWLKFIVKFKLNIFSFTSIGGCC